MKTVPRLELLLLSPLLLLLHLVVVGLVAGLVVKTSKSVWWSLNASWCWDLGREYMAVECRQCFLNSNDSMNAFNATRRDHLTDAREIYSG